jgi:hypothetical protein
MYINHPEAVKVALTAYPDYTGKKFQIEVSSSPINVRSYWEGGSRSYYTFLRLDTLAVMPIPQQSAFDKQLAGADSVSLIPGMVCVKHTIFCGKDMGITIYVHSENAPRLLPVNTVEITDHEKTVLFYTRSLKSSYGGISNYRFYTAHKEKGITLEAWEETKASLIAKGMLDKRGALTMDGRNAIGKTTRWE